MDRRSFLKAASGLAALTPDLLRAASSRIKHIGVGFSSISPTGRVPRGTLRRKDNKSGSFQELRDVAQRRGRPVYQDVERELRLQFLFFAR